MNVVDYAVPAMPASVPPAPPVPRQAIGRFLGSERAFFGLLVRGSVLLLFTLGIYRFWLTTDVRRFLWGHTEIAGDGLEYTGTARELLIGFLMAIALLLPINGLIFLATFAPGLLAFSGVIGFVLLAVLGQFAVYRARRYRLSRTVYRGVRLYQTGSAWRYAITAILWWVLIALTAGLLYPWAQASLERYKMRHTHYGNLPGSFHGSGTRLFFRGFLLWLVVVGPFVAGIIIAIAAVDWLALAAAIGEGGSNVWSRIETSNPQLAVALVVAMSGVGWAIFAATLLYPAFRALVQRWWVSGLRLGSITATSHLRTGQVYRLYLRFLGYSMLFAIGASILGGIIFAVLGAAASSIGKSASIEIGITALGLLAYLIVALGYSAIYQATVMIRFWRLSFEMTELTGLEALDRVEARGAAGSPFGEGLADALDVGGL